MLNVVACLTNLLFYDIPQEEMIDDATRRRMFKRVSPLILFADNEEIQVESVRVLSNLSRHQNICLEFVQDKSFLEALIIVLDHTVRDLVFYAVGIIINVTLNSDARQKILQKGALEKLIDVLKDANIEDMDLAKVAAKGLLNLTGEQEYWVHSQIEKLDAVLTNLGEELDSIIEVANEEEQKEILQLRQLVNDLINNMPEPMYRCEIDNCGRKFKSQAELEQHAQRRHKKP